MNLVVMHSCTCNLVSDFVRCSAYKHNTYIQVDHKLRGWETQTTRRRIYSEEPAARYHCAQFCNSERLLRKSSGSFLATIGDLNSYCAQLLVPTVSRVSPMSGFSEPCLTYLASHTLLVIMNDCEEG